MLSRSATPSRKPSSSSTTRMRRFGARFLEPPDFTYGVSYTVANHSRQEGQLPRAVWSVVALASFCRYDRVPSRLRLETAGPIDLRRWVRGRGTLSRPVSGSTHTGQ